MLLLVVLAIWHSKDVMASIRECGDSFLAGGYVLLTVYSAAVCILSWIILIRRKAPVYICVGAAVFLLGLANIYVFKGLSAPDEISHYISAYKLSDQLLGTAVTDEHGQVYVRACDLFLEDTEWRLEEVRAASAAGDESVDATLKIYGAELTEEVYRMDHELSALGAEEFAAWYMSNTGFTGIIDSEEAGPDSISASAEENAAARTAGDGADETDISGADGLSAMGLSCQWTVNTTPIAYLPQAIGISLARIMGFGPMRLIAIGRLFNLILFTAAVTFAVRLLPEGGELTGGTALIPMSLHLAGSMSYDVFVMSASFVFIALIFNMREHGLSRSKTAAAAIVLAALAPCKIVYSLLIICILLTAERLWSGSAAAGTASDPVPSEERADCKDHPDTVSVAGTGMSAAAENVITGGSRSRNRHAELRRFLLLGACCLVLACISMYLINSATIGNYAAADERIIEWAEEPEGYTLSYLLHRPVETADMFYKSFLMMTGNWFSTMFGIYLGNQDPVLNVPYPIIGLLAAGLLALAAGSKLRLSAYGKCISALTFAAVFAALMGSMLLAYTPVSAAYIQGVQGRYLLPVLPLLLSIIPGTYISVREGSSRVILWSFIAAECYVLLRVYATVCLRIG